MKKVRRVIRKYKKSANHKLSSSGKIAAFEELYFFERELPFEYGRVMIDDIRYHRNIPLVVGHIILDEVPSDIAFQDFFKNFFRQIRSEPHSEMSEYVRWLKEHFDLPDEGERFEFEFTYTEFLYPGGPDYGYNLFVSCPEPSDISLEDVRYFIEDILDEVEAEEVPKQLIEQAAGTLHKAMQDYVEECNRFLASAEDVIWDYVKQLGREEAGE